LPKITKVKIFAIFVKKIVFFGQIWPIKYSKKFGVKNIPFWGSKFLDSEILGSKMFHFWVKIFIRAACRFDSFF
jgi:hypothetical protein